MCSFNSDHPVRSDLSVHSYRSRALRRAVALIALVLAALALAPARAQALCDLSIGDASVAPGDTGPGWSYPAEGQLELNGFAGGPITCYGDLTLTLTGSNSAGDSTQNSSATSMTALEVWGSLTVCGQGRLAATGSQHGLFVLDALAVHGAKVACVATGAGIADELVAGLRAGSALLGQGAVVEARAQVADASAQVAAVGAYVGSPAGANAAALTVNASTLHASGATAGVLAGGISLVSARVTLPNQGSVREAPDLALGMPATVCAAEAQRSSAEDAVEPATEARIEPYAEADPVAGELEPAEPAGETGAGTAPELSEAEVPRVDLDAPTTVVKQTVAVTRVSKRASQRTLARLPLAGDASGELLAVAAVLALAGLVLACAGAGAAVTTRLRG